jgi:hypothetical protein
MFSKDEPVIMIKKIISRLVFFIGWLLSPFTTWNDVFINIPLAYLCASLLYKAMGKPLVGNFAITIIVMYWATNGLGVLLMYLAGRNVIKEKSFNFRSVLTTLLAYSIALFLMDKFIALRPIP